MIFGSKGRLRQRIDEVLHGRLCRRPGLHRQIRRGRNRPDDGNRRRDIREGGRLFVLHLRETRLRSLSCCSHCLGGIEHPLLVSGFGAGIQIRAHRQRNFHPIGVMRDTHRLIQRIRQRLFIGRLLPFRQRLPANPKKFINSLLQRLWIGR